MCQRFIKKWLLAGLVLVLLLTVGLIPQYTHAASLYGFEMSFSRQQHEHSGFAARVNYILMGKPMYYYLESSKARSTAQSIILSYSKDNGNTWTEFKFKSKDQVDTAGYTMVFPEDYEADNVLIRIQVMFVPKVGSNTRDEIIAGPFKVYQAWGPTEGRAVTNDNGSITISFRDNSTVEDQYLVTRRGDGQEVQFVVPSHTSGKGVRSFTDQTTNTKKSTKYTYTVEPQFITVPIPQETRPSPITILAETKASLLLNLSQYHLDAAQSQLKLEFPSVLERLKPKEDEQEEEDDNVIISITVPWTWKHNGEDQPAEAPEEAGAIEDGANLEAVEEEVAEMNALLDATVESASNWAKDEIKAAILLNLTTGEVLSDYQAPITREHFAGLIVKLYEKYKGEAVPEPLERPFLDTEDAGVAKAHALSLVHGRTQDLFAPYDLAARQEISVMLWRFFHLEGLVGLIPSEPFEAFADANQVAPWASEAADYNAAIGLIKGRGNQTFAPKEMMTRQEAIALIKRAYDAIEGL